MKQYCNIMQYMAHYSIGADQRSAYAWFLKITFVPEVSMRVCLCVGVSLRLLVTKYM